MPAHRDRSGFRPRRRLAPAVAAALLWPALAVAAPEMVRIPAGDFTMGSPAAEPGSLDDEALHVVRIGHDFLLGRTEVTQALWSAVMGANPSYYDAFPENPVESITWDDAVVFCNRLSAREGLTPAYAIDGARVTWDMRSDGYRLPTEAEWEYACRAGTTTPFATGACLATSAANYNGYAPLDGCPDGLARGEPIDVGRFSPNEWGLCDLHGNVHEWCWDWYGRYPPADAVVIDPTGPPGGERRVARGGSWSNSAARCRSAKRDAQPPETRLDVLGLRLARNAGGPR